MGKNDWQYIFSLKLMGYIKMFLQVYDKQKSLETLLWSKNLFVMIVSIFEFIQWYILGYIDLLMWHKDINLIIFYYNDLNI